MDDHAILRQSLRQYFADEPDLRVEAEAGSGREAIELVRTKEVDVLIMDISMPEQSGMDALAMVRAMAPDVGILVFTMFPEEQYALPLLKQGVDGFLNKEADPEEILKAVRTIASGHPYFSDKVAQLLAQSLSTPTDTLRSKLRFGHEEL